MIKVSVIIFYHLDYMDFFWRVVCVKYLIVILATDVADRRWF